MLEGGVPFLVIFSVFPVISKLPSVEWTGVGAWTTEFPPYWAVVQGLLKPWGAEMGSPSSPKDHMVLPGVHVPAPFFRRSFWVRVSIPRG